MQSVGKDRGRCGATGTRGGTWQSSGEAAGLGTWQGRGGPGSVEAGAINMVRVPRIPGEEAGGSQGRSQGKATSEAPGTAGAFSGRECL